MLEPTAQPEAVAELFRGRRMVLDIQCGDGTFLGRLVELGVPGVGVDTDTNLVMTARGRQLRTWAGTWRVVANHPQKFDGIHVDLDRPEDWEEVHELALETLAEGLMPRGVLVITGPPALLERTTAKTPERLERRGSTGGAVVLTRLPQSGEPYDADATGIIVGPYADAFVGCENVLDLGCGRGRFLDHLRVRDVPSSGIEPEREFVVECSERDLAVEQGGAELLADRPERYDGIFIGNLFDSMPLADCEQILRLGHYALRPGGRVLARCVQRRHDPAALQQAFSQLGYGDVHAATLPGDDRDYFVMGTRQAQTVPPPPRIAPPIYTRDREIDLPLRSLHDLERFERKVYSQGGEDGVLAAIFDIVGVTNRYYVEFGCGDGIQCNTTKLRRQGWQGLLMDGAEECAAEDAIIHKEWITAANINELLAKHNVPRDFDLLSLDIDGNDYWVLEALEYRPRVIVAEYNGNLAVDRSLTIPQDPDHTWDGSDYYGASLLALTKLAERKGYTLVYCNGAGVNAFFVHQSLTGKMRPRPVSAIFRPANYWYRGGRQYPDLSRSMIDPDATASRA